MADDLGILGGHVAKSKVEKAYLAEVKREVLKRFKPGERVVNPTTGDVGEVDPASPTGIRPLWKATNRAAHGGAVRLGKEAVPVTKAKKDAAPYGKPGTPESMAKAKKDIEDFRRGIR